MYIYICIYNRNFLLVCIILHGCYFSIQPSAPKMCQRKSDMMEGWHGITKEECLKRGSCYDNTSCKQCNWCYISPEKLTGKECPLVAPPAAKKVNYFSIRTFFLLHCVQTSLPTRIYSCICAVKT